LGESRHAALVIAFASVAPNLASPTSDVTGASTTLAAASLDTPFVSSPASPTATAASGRTLLDWTFARPQAANATDATTSGEMGARMDRISGASRRRTANDRDQGPRIATGEHVRS
jgi:uncharacterized protein involved in type VI secretion and phage assembly